MISSTKRVLVAQFLLLACFALVFSAGVAIAEKKININTATVEELQTLPKIGPKTAEAIVKYRKEHPFKSVDELTEIKGIGEKKLEKIKPLVTVGKKGKKGKKGSTAGK